MKHNKNSITYEKASSLRLIILVLVFSWVPWFILSQLDIQNKEAHPLYIIGGIGPLVAALLCWLWDKKKGVIWKNLLLGGKKNFLSFILLSVLFGAAPIFISGFIAPLLGGPAVDLTLGQKAIDGYGGVIPFLLVTLFAGPTTEEVAWHGYLWPRYRSFESRLKASVILGLIWGLWHFPLFLISGTTQNTGGGIFSLYFFFFILSGLFQTYLFAFIYEFTGYGVYSAIGMHFFINFSSYFIEYSWQARTIEMILLALLCVAAYTRIQNKELVPSTLAAGKAKGISKS